MDLNYEQAFEYATAGKPVVYSSKGSNGGWKRYAHFTLAGKNVEVRIFRTLVAVFYPKRGAWLTSAGHSNYAVTRDCLNFLLPYGQMGSEDYTVYYSPSGEPHGDDREPWTDGKTFSYERPRRARKKEMEDA